MENIGTYYQKIKSFEIVEEYKTEILNEVKKDYDVLINSHTYLMKEENLLDMKKHINLYSIKVRAYEEHARNGNTYLELEYQVVKDDKGKSIGLLSRLGKKGWA